jgi:4'-phosphopantetheinyl transferase
VEASAIEVWISTTDAASIAVCTDGDRARAARYTRAESGRRWLAARAVLRTILAEVANTDGRALTITEDGKPALAEHPDIHFSVSHTQTSVAVAVAGRPVGIDIEAPRQLHNLARRIGVAPEDALQEWTRIEALLKATGQGLAGGTRGTVARLRATGWDVRDLDAAPLVGAVAAHGDDWSIVLR